MAESELFGIRTVISGWAEHKESGKGAQGTTGRKERRPRPSVLPQNFQGKDRKRVEGAAEEPG